MKFVAFDFETSNQNKHTCDIALLCVTIVDEGTSTTKAFTSPTKELRSIMKNSPIAVAHNASFDQHLMEERWGVPIRGELHDTMLTLKHWRNDLPAYGLKSLAWWFLQDLYFPLLKLRQWIHENNIKTDSEEDEDFDMTKPPIKLVEAYCSHDTKITARLFAKFYPLVKDNEAYRQDTQCIRYVTDMCARGIYVDREFYKEAIRLGNRRIKRNTKQATEIMQVPEGKKPTGNAIRDRLAIRGETRKTKTGKVKANEVVLRDHMEDPAVAAVSRIRTDQKTVSTYAENILAATSDAKPYFYPGMIQSGAITRRFRAVNIYSPHGPVISCQVQNFPKGPDIRGGIVAPPGFKFAKRDLASVEARLGAHAMSVFINNPTFCNQYKKDDSFNIYIHVGSNCEKRQISKKEPIYAAYKQACLGIQYGAGINAIYTTLHDTFNLPYNLDECADIRKNILKNHPEFSHLQRAVTSLIDKQGYVMDDFGAKYYVPSDAIYKGVNYYCQGCAGNVLKWWWHESFEMMKHTEDYTFNTVHDEFDDAIKDDKGGPARLQSYCDVLYKLDLFDLPIRAEHSGLVDSWGVAG